MFWCLLALAVAGGSYGLTVRVRQFIYHSDFFRIDPARIRIAGASETLQKDAMVRLRTVLPAFQNNLFKVDTSRLVSELKSLPRTRNAWVGKAYPQGLTIRFEERQPLMLVNLDRPWLVDGEGILLAGAQSSQVHALGLPVLTGVRGTTHRPGDRIQQPRLAEVFQAVQFVRDHDPSVYDAIAEWNINEMDEVSATLHGGVTVRFGTQPPIELLDKLSAALDRKPQLLQETDYIDLRMERQVVYNTRVNR